MYHIVKTDFYGNKSWYNSKGQLHREDGPAIEYAHGAKLWYRNGRLIGQPPQPPGQTIIETPKIKPAVFDQILSLLVENPHLINKTSETISMLQQQCEAVEKE